MEQVERNAGYFLCRFCKPLKKEIRYHLKLIDELKKDFKKLAGFLTDSKKEKRYEERRCDFCMAKTKHEVLVVPKIITKKRRWLYKCTQCNHERWLIPYRTVAESLY